MENLIDLGEHEIALDIAVLALRKFGLHLRVSLLREPRKASVSALAHYFDNFAKFLVLCQLL